jgi:hypothetical protein
MRLKAEYQINTQSFEHLNLHKGDREKIIKKEIINSLVKKLSEDLGENFIERDESRHPDIITFKAEIVFLPKKELEDIQLLLNSLKGKSSEIDAVLRDIYFRL